MRIRGKMEGESKVDTFSNIYLGKKYQYLFYNSRVTVVMERASKDYLRPSLWT